MAGSRGDGPHGQGRPRFQESNEDRGEAEDDDALLLLPPEELPVVSRRIALAVGAEVQHQGLAPQAAPEDWERTLEARRWEPRYLPLRWKG